MIPTPLFHNFNLNVGLANVLTSITSFNTNLFWFEGTILPRRIYLYSDFQSSCLWKVAIMYFTSACSVICLPPRTWIAGARTTKRGFSSSPRGKFQTLYIGKRWLLLAKSRWEKKIATVRQDRLQIGCLPDGSNHVFRFSSSSRTGEIVSVSITTGVFHSVSASPQLILKVPRPEFGFEFICHS